MGGVSVSHPDDSNEDVCTPQLYGHISSKFYIYSLWFYLITYFFPSFIIPPCLLSRCAFYVFI